MRFSVFTDSILSENWLFLYINNDISSTHARARGHATQPENVEKMCNLVGLGVYLDQILHSNCFFLK